jgi:hypothetical protein
MTETVGDRLLAVHSGFIDGPLPERFEEASCGPHAKHLAYLAIQAAEVGGTPDQWRSWVGEHVPEASSELLVEAEECMRGSGVWPWKA